MVNKINEKMSKRNETKLGKYRDGVTIYGMIEAVMCNPNGDPSNGNRPRSISIDGLEYGMISGVRIKRTIRDAAAYGIEADLLCKAGAIFNDVIPQREKNGEPLIEYPKKKTESFNRDDKVAMDNVGKLRNEFWDIKNFGLTVTGDLQRALGGASIYGVWEIPMTNLSTNPIVTQPLAITRNCASSSREASNSEPADGETGNAMKAQNMGVQYFVQRAYYPIVIKLRPSTANLYGYTEKDVEEFYEVVCKMFDWSPFMGASKTGMNWLDKPQIFASSAGTIQTQRDQMDISWNDKEENRSLPVSPIATVEYRQRAVAKLKIDVPITPQEIMGKMDKTKK